MGREYVGPQYKEIEKRGVEDRVQSERSQNKAGYSWPREKLSVNPADKLECEG